MNVDENGFFYDSAGHKKKDARSFIRRDVRFTPRVNFTTVSRARKRPGDYQFSRRACTRTRSRSGSAVVNYEAARSRTYCLLSSNCRSYFELENSFGFQRCIRDASSRCGNVVLKTKTTLPNLSESRYDRYLLSRLSLRGYHCSPDVAKRYRPRAVIMKFRNSVSSIQSDCRLTSNRNLARNRKPDS